MLKKQIRGSKIYYLGKNKWRNECDKLPKKCEPQWKSQLSFEMTSYLTVNSDVLLKLFCHDGSTVDVILDVKH